MTLCWSPRSSGRADISNTFVFAVVVPRAENADADGLRSRAHVRWRPMAPNQLESGGDVQEVGLDVRGEETTRPNLEGAVVYETTRLQVIWLHAAHCLFVRQTVFMITGSGANAATESVFFQRL